MNILRKPMVPSTGLKYVEWGTSWPIWAGCKMGPVQASENGELVNSPFQSHHFVFHHRERASDLSEKIGLFRPTVLLFISWRKTNLGKKIDHVRVPIFLVWQEENWYNENLERCSISWPMWIGSGKVRNLPIFKGPGRDLLFLAELHNPWREPSSSFLSGSGDHTLSQPRRPQTVTSCENLSFV